MIQFTEAIQLLDGQLQRLYLHQQRVDRTSLFFYSVHLNLQQLIPQIPSTMREGLYKCRVLYDKEIQEVQWIPYIPKVRQRVVIVDAVGIEYRFKYANRILFEHLAHQYPADDLILTQNGYVTDSLYANLVFENSKGLFTPSLPLLKGTRRQQLLNKNIIVQTPISVQDISQYQWVHFINAMIGLGDIPPVSVKNISSML